MGFIDRLRKAHIQSTYDRQFVELNWILATKVVTQAIRVTSYVSGYGMLVIA